MRKNAFRRCRSAPRTRSSERLSRACAGSYTTRSISSPSPLPWLSNTSTNRKSTGHRTQQKHVRIGRDLVRRSFEEASNTGDLICAANYGLQMATNHLMAGDPLERTPIKLYHVRRRRFKVLAKASSALGKPGDSVRSDTALAEAECGAESGLAFAQKARFGMMIDGISSQLALIRTLRGLTKRFGSFDDEQFDELQIECRFSQNPNLAVCECWYWIRKLQ